MKKNTGKVSIGDALEDALGSKKELESGTKVVKHTMDIILISLLVFLFITNLLSFFVFYNKLESQTFEQLTELLDILFLRMIPVFTFALGFYVKGSENKS